MTRIGILTTHPPGQSLGTTKRVVGLAHGVQTNSVECVLLSPYPARPRWWDAGEFASLATSPGQRVSGTARQLAIEAFYRWKTVRRLALRNPSRIRSEVQSLGRALVVRTGGLHLDLLQAEQQVAAAAACSVKRELDMPVIADLHNVWSAELVEEGLASPGSGVEREARALDARIATDADGILVPDREMRDYFVEQLGADRTRTWVVPTGATPHASGPSSPPPPFRLVYSGTVSSWVRFDPFLDACALLRGDGLDLVLLATGRGPGRRRLRRLARERGVRLEFFWLPTEEEYFRFLATCHVGIVPWAASASRTFAVAGKMYDYLAAGLPVVATGSGSWAEDVTREDIGRCVRDDPQEIAAALRGLLTDEVLRKRMASNGIAFLAREFSWSQIAKVAVGAYETVRPTPRGASG